MTGFIADVEVLLLRGKVQGEGLAFVRQAGINVLLEEIKGAGVINLAYKGYCTEIAVDPVEVKTLAAVGSAVGPQLRINVFSALRPQALDLILFSLDQGGLVQLSLQLLKGGAFFHLYPAAGGGLHAFHFGIIPRGAGTTPHHLYAPADEPQGQHRHAHALRVTQGRSVIGFDTLGQAPLRKGLHQSPL